MIDVDALGASLERAWALADRRRGASEAALRRSQRLEEASAIRRGLRDSDHRLCATALAYARARARRTSARRRRYSIFSVLRT